jgi:ADP-heptose:LPS heptosyltransferase
VAGASGSVLIVHPGALGDVLLALPALAHLAHVRPGAHRVLATAPRVAALLADAECVEETGPLDALGLHRLFTGDGDAATLARLAGHDTIVSWLGAGDPVFRRHLAALDGAGTRRVIVARGSPGLDAARHAAWHFLDTLAPLGPLPGALPPVRLAAGPVERAWAAAWLEARAAAAGPVVLHPGAGSPGKVWPGMAALGRRLVVRGLPVVAVTGPAEPEAGVPGAHAAPDLTLRQLVALFERAAVVVGHDSGLTHLAAVVGCPTIALFGPTAPAVWSPVGPAVTVLAGAGSSEPDPWRGLDPEQVEQTVLDCAGEIVRAMTGPAPPSPRWVGEGGRGGRREASK